MLLVFRRHDRGEDPVARHDVAVLAVVMHGQLGPLLFKFGIGFANVFARLDGLQFQGGFLRAVRQSGGDQHRHAGLRLRGFVTNDHIIGPAKRDDDTREKKGEASHCNPEGSTVGFILSELWRRRSGIGSGPPDVGWRRQQAAREH